MPREHRRQYYTWCDPYQEQYENEKDYYQHFVNTPQHFPCTVCCEIAFEEENWDYHIITDHGSQEALDKHINRQGHTYCTLGKKWFTHRSLFEHHERELHEPNWPYICKPCDQAFPEWGNREQVYYPTDISTYHAVS